MRIIAKRNIICIPTKFDVMSPDQVKHELMEHIAKLDEGATRWRKSYLGKQRVKGTTGIR